MIIMGNIDNLDTEAPTELEEQPIVAYKERGTKNVSP